jgi:hypothetical protein
VKERPPGGCRAGSDLLETAQARAAAAGSESASPMQRRSDVRGTITGKDVLVHSFTILRLWGPGVYLRCLRALATREPCTFLGVLAQQQQH